MKRGSVTRSQALLLAATAVRGVVALAVTVVLGRTLDEDDFGQFALLGVLLTLADILLDFGTGPVAAREIARTPEREPAVLGIAMGFRRAAGAVAAVAVAGWGLVAFEGGDRIVVLGVAVVLTVTAPRAYFAAFQVRQAQEHTAVAVCLSQLLVLAGAVGLAAARATGHLYGWLLVAREAVYYALLAVGGRRVLERVPRPSLRHPGTRAFLAAAAVQGAATVAYATYFHVDVFLVRGLRGADELGAYASAFRLVNPLLMLPGILALPMLPVHAAQAEGDRSVFARRVADRAALLLGVGALAAVALSLLARDVVAVLYGGRYLDGPLASGPALAWLGIGLGAAFPLSAYATALTADRRERGLLGLALTGLVVNVAGNVALLPVMGFTGAALVTAVTETAVLAGAMALFGGSCRRAPLPVSCVRQLVPAAGLAVLIVGTHSLGAPSPAANLAVGAAGGLAGLVLLLVDAWRREDGRQE